MSKKKKKEKEENEYQRRIRGNEQRKKMCHKIERIKIYMENIKYLDNFFFFFLV